MTRPNTTDLDAERAREAAEARAALERRATEQGVKPFDPVEWQAEPAPDVTPEETRREVDEFLHLVRDTRALLSPRSAG
jgi:hypothetical protein